MHWVSLSDLNFAECTPVTTNSLANFSCSFLICGHDVLTIDTTERPEIKQYNFTPEIH
jgi:hypothetical protein